MRKSNYNSDYLVNQLMMFSKFFENFKKLKDTQNMFVVLYQIRVIHGMMLVKQNKIIKKVTLNEENNNNYYDLSIFSNLLESTNELIHKYEKILYDLLEKDKEDVLKEESDVLKEESDVLKEESGVLKEESDVLKEESDSDVVLIELNSEEKKYSKEYPTVIYFYAPWCKYCKEFKPIWIKLKEKLIEMKINFFEIDCNKKKEYCKDFEIEEYPSIKMFYNKKIYNFDKSRSLDNLIDFILNTTSLKN